MFAATWAKLDEKGDQLPCWVIIDRKRWSHEILDQERLICKGVSILTSRYPPHCILGPDLLERLARTGDEEVRSSALDTLMVDHRFRLARAESAARTGGVQARPITFSRVGGQPNRTVYDQHHHAN